MKENLGAIGISVEFENVKEESWGPVGDGRAALKTAWLIRYGRSSPRSALEIRNWA
jgi:hypothetical protein